MQCFDRGAEAFGWKRRDPQPGAHARRRLAGRLGLRHGHLSDASGAGDGAGDAARRRPGAGADRGARYRHRHLHRGRPAAAERLGLPLDGRGRAGRQRAAAGAGRRRLEHHRQRLHRGDAGLRRRSADRLAPRGGRRPAAGRDPATLRLADGTLRAPDGSEPIAEAMARASAARSRSMPRTSRMACRRLAKKLYAGQAGAWRRAEGEGSMPCAFGAEFVEVRVHTPHARDARAAAGRRLRRRPHRQPAHRAQPADGRA